MTIGQLLEEVFPEMDNNKLAVVSIIVLAAAISHINTGIAIADSNTGLPTDSCADAFGSQLGFCAEGKNDTANVYLQEQHQNQNSTAQPPLDYPWLLGDQRIYFTAEGNTTATATSYRDAARCKNVYVNKAPNSPTVSDDDTVDNCPLPADPEGGSDQDPGRIPTTRDILYLAAATIHPNGAGLHKRPSRTSYTNKYVPTLVAATHPTQTHTINLLGHDITVTLTATSYTWSWGDGTPDLTTTSPGMPWHKGMDPNTDPALIRHYYTPPNGWRSRFDGPYPDATRTITLTTTWSGTATNPFTGETQTINGLVTTKETTGPFPLNHLIVSNTDTWEEKQGH